MFFFYDNENEPIFKVNSIESAYLLLLNDELSSASEIFTIIDSPRSRWGKSLTEIISGYLKNYPTYFGIRNFLEIDLELLLRNNKIDYVEQVLGSLSILAEINTETYKYVSRVLMINNLYKAAEKYLMLAKNTMYNDPELHYLMTNYYLYNNDYKEADKCIKECLRILPDYYPALLLSKKIQLSLIDET